MLIFLDHLLGGWGHRHKQKVQRSDFLNMKLTSEGVSWKKLDMSNETAVYKDIINDGEKVIKTSYTTLGHFLPCHFIRLQVANFSVALG